MSASADLAAQLTAAGIPFSQEHTFAKPRRWRFDFMFPGDVALVAEVEGGQWIEGRHTRGSGFEADCVKYGCAVALGWKVLRVTPAMIESGLALHLIEAALGRVPLKIPKPPAPRRPASKSPPKPPKGEPRAERLLPSHVAAAARRARR